MSTTAELINSLYTNKEELEKMAQFELEKRAAFGTLEKIANEAQLDLSQLNEDDKVNLWNYLINEMASEENQGQAEGVVDPQSQTAQTTPTMQEQPGVAPQGQSNEFMNYVSADPQRAQDFYYKMAEAQITSDFWAENAASKFLDKVAFGMAKIAEAMEGGEEVQEEVSEGSFDALAKERAMAMRQEHEKKAAFEELLNQRALELLNEGKV